MPKLVSTNPAKNYEEIGSVEISTDEEIDAVILAAQKSKREWKELGLKKRIELLRPICEEFKSRADEIADLIVKEVGKPISESKGEASGYVEEFEWFLDNAKKALQDEVTHEDNESLHRIVYEPHGVACVITPWNFPFGMAIWGIIPNLLAGNTVVFKISEECPLMGKFIDEIFVNHDLPKGVFSQVYGDGNVGRKLSKQDVDLLWFTGSTKVGKQIYKTAADKFIKVILEMGGSNPFIIFEDADLDLAVARVYKGRFQNCGQVCDASKRLIVHESLFDEAVDKLKKIVEKKLVGDPNNPKTDIGSLVAKRQVEALEIQVADAIDKGAKVIVGGKKPEKLQGAYYRPTILTNISKNMKVWKEEVFGPVLPIIKFSSEDEAVELANDTKYGLGSKFYTKDKARIRRVSSRIEAGSVEVNQGSRWLCCNPFGGYKNSGMGREHGILGFRELCQVKVISESK
ncbi:MAG: aldehyde dehydrogenase family protein [Patescibacteria group bacterium]